MGLYKYNNAASGGQHSAFHGAISQRDDQPHGCRCCERSPARVSGVVVGQ